MRNGGRGRSIFTVSLGVSLGLALGLGACVPNGPPTGSDGGGRATTESKPKPMTLPPRPPPPPTPPPPPPAVSASGSPGTSPSPAAQAAPPSVPLGGKFADDFERPTLGSNWNATSTTWHLEAGKLCGKGAKNHGVWLARVLPTNVRIEFDALSRSPDGDLKAEIFGDGASGASGISYNDATSYLTIFGGWKNTFHVLARLNEHGADRMEIRVDPNSGDDRQHPVVPGRDYHFKVERQAGARFSWWIGDKLMFGFTDPSPLVGVGHDHFGFNDWDVEVCFDNVTVTAL